MLKDQVAHDGRGASADAAYTVHEHSATGGHSLTQIVTYLGQLVEQVPGRTVHALDAGVVDVGGHQPRENVVCRQQRKNVSDAAVGEVGGRHDARHKQVRQDVGN